MSTLLHQLIENLNFCRGEERSGEKQSIDMKSSSSEESVRKRSHSVGANSLTPSALSVMTTTNICDINDAVMDVKQDILGELRFWWIFCFSVGFVRKFSHTFFL